MSRLWPTSMMSAAVASRMMSFKRTSASALPPAHVAASALISTPTGPTGGGTGMTPSVSPVLRSAPGLVSSLDHANCLPACAL